MQILAFMLSTFGTLFQRKYPLTSSYSCFKHLSKHFIQEHDIEYRFENVNTKDAISFAIGICMYVFVCECM